MAGRSKKIPFANWESTKPDGIENRYIRLANTQMISVAMRSLSNSAYRIYVNMKLESKGNVQFEFPFSKYKSYMTRPTFEKGVNELVEKGFIDVVQRNANLRKPNVYRFSDKWKLYIPLL